MNENNSPIALDLSIEQINQILDALGQQPYRNVYQLVGEIRQQCDKQLSQSNLQSVKSV